jgi:D-alanyl-D-alanine carboxypeptidase
MKRLISIVGILLVLFVAMGSLARCTGPERGESAQSAGVQAGVELLMGELRARALPAGGPSTNAPNTNSFVEDILLVNPENPLPKDFRAVNLVNLYDQKGKHFHLANAGIKLSKDVFEAMDAMFAAARKDGVSGFIVTSGYRSREEQMEIFLATTDGTAAKPGESEHETGLAFDVTAMGNESFELTPQYEWLLGHCGEYGFIIRYPKGGEDVTGYPYEPWHYRYVGREHAARIMDMGITLEEYLEGS